MSFKVYLISDAAEDILSLYEYVSENDSTEKLSKDYSRSWRYKIGPFMIIAGHLVLLLASVLPFPEVPATIMGAAVSMSMMSMGA